MAKDEIIEKLRKEISKNTLDESHVVYILSRIRKYLELTAQKDKYPYLWFYCNWALHPKIDRKLPAPVEKMLGDYFKMANEKCLWDFDFLKEDLKSFLHDVGLPTDIVEADNKFTELKKTVFEIYSNTPVQFILGPMQLTLTAYTSENKRMLRWGMSPAPRKLLPPRRGETEIR